MRSKNPTVGVLGGMGPAAALEFCQRLLAATPGVVREQDHLRVVLDNNATIPDRTAAIQGRGPSPLREVLRSARALEAAGAAFIVIPCNTIHRWYDEIARGVRTPLLHLIRITADAALARTRGKGPLGFMATDGALASALYQHELNARGQETLVPAPAEQRAVMAAIHDIKVGRRLPQAARTMRRVAESLARRGAKAVILGCTEIGLVLRDDAAPVPIMDSLDALVAETLRRAGRFAQKPRKRNAR